MSAHFTVIILFSETLNVRTSNCFMSIYFTDLHIVYLFQSMLFYVSVIVYEEASNCLLSTYEYFIDMFFGFLFTGISFTVWDFICSNF